MQGSRSSSVHRMAIATVACSSLCVSVLAHMALPSPCLCLPVLRPAPAFTPTASRTCLSSAQRQLLSRIVRTAHMRLRLDAFLLHHKAWATAAWPAGQQPGPVAGAGARGGTAADAGAEAAEQGQGAGQGGGGAANPIMQAFLACLEELLAMQTSALQVRREARAKREVIGIKAFGVPDSIATLPSPRVHGFP